MTTFEPNQRLRHGADSHYVNLVKQAVDHESNARIGCAAKGYLEALNYYPSFEAFRAYAFCQANLDRAQILKVGADYLASQTSTIAQAKVLEILLPYAESERRRLNGLDEYSSDHIDEPQFQFAALELLRFQRAVAASVKTNGYAPDVRRLRVMAEFSAGNYETVDQLMPHLAGMDPRTTAAKFGVAFYAGIEDAARGAVQRWLPPMRLRTMPPKSMDRRVFTGCDYGYWVKYGRGLARSVRQCAGPGVVLHLHLFDPPARLEGLKSELEGSFGDNFCLSTEDTGFASHHERARLYYASIRLPRLYQLVAADRVPTIFLDTDLYVSGDLGPVFDAVASRDVILCRMPGRLPFHTQMNASFVGISGRDLSLKFLQRVTGYIAQTFQANNVPWCLDQISLNCVLRNMQIRDVKIDAVACGPAVYNGTYDALCVPQKVSEWSPEYAKMVAFQQQLGAEDGNHDPR